MSRTNNFATCLKRALVTTISVQLLGFSSLFAQSESPSTLKAELLTKIQKNFDALNSQSVLYIKYKLTYNHIVGIRNFALDKATIDTKRDGEKLWLSIEGQRRREPQTRLYSYAWDGSVGSSSQDGQISIGAFPDTRLFYYNYYFDALGYPVPAVGASSLVQGQAAGKRVNYPDSIIKNADSFHVDETVIDNKSYIIATWDQHEIYYFDREHGFSLARRDLFNTKTGCIKQIYRFSEFERINSLTLPKKIVVEDFQVDSCDPTKPSSRKTIEVEQLSSDRVQDFVYRVISPTGSTVHDTIKNQMFKRYEKGANPLLTSAEAARAKYAATQQRIPLYVIAVGIVAVAVALSFLVRWYRRR